MGNESECMNSNLAISENWLVQVKVIESKKCAKKMFF